MAEDTPSLALGKRLFAFHRELWQKLVDAGAEVYLKTFSEPGWSTEAGGGNADRAEAEKRLLELLEAIWPEVEKHFWEEEGALVPQMKPIFGDNVGPLAYMLKEHQTLRAAAFELLFMSGQVSPEERSSRLFHLLLLIEDHLNQEKYIFFPLVQEVLSKG